MAPLKLKGDQAEIEVARDLVRRGFRIAIPYGEDWDFDLIFQRPESDRLERVQVKYATERKNVIPVRTRSASLTNGKIKRYKLYTAKTIDWIAVYSPNTDACYYVHASELGHGRNEISLRLTPTLNCQLKGVRYADDYVDPVAPAQAELGMEPAGFEPATSSVQATRSPN
jgi:PD-(D/E)XK endonuclease